MQHIPTMEGHKMDGGGRGWENGVFWWREVGSVISYIDTGITITKLCPGHWCINQSGRRRHYQTPLEWMTSSGRVAKHGVLKDCLIEKPWKSAMATPLAGCRHQGTLHSNADTHTGTLKLTVKMMHHQSSFLSKSYKNRHTNVASLLVMSHNLQRCSTHSSSFFTA